MDSLNKSMHRAPFKIVNIISLVNIKNLLYNHKVFLIFLLIVGCLSVSCEEESKKDKIIWEKPIMQSFNDFTIESDSARISKKISGAQMDRYENGNISYPKGVFVEFYDKKGKVRQTLKADSAYFNKTDQLLAAKGNVVLNEYEEGTILNTEEIFWNQDQKKIFSKAKVKIQSDQQIISGNGLEADQTFKKWKVIKVTGIIPVPEEVEED